MYASIQRVSSFELFNSTVIVSGLGRYISQAGSESLGGLGCRLGVISPLIPVQTPFPLLAFPSLV
jgi:hypothetical protein